MPAQLTPHRSYAQQESNVGTEFSELNTLQPPFVTLDVDAVRLPATGPNAMG